MIIPDALNDEKFAAHKESIQIFYLVDDDFRIMCDDYSTTKTYMDEYHEKIQEDTQCKKECENLFTELEKEILRYIKNIEI